MKTIIYRQARQRFSHAALSLIVGALCTVALTARSDDATAEKNPPKYFDAAQGEQQKEWLPVKPFVGDFESGDFSGWGVREGGREDSLQVVADPVRCGRRAAKFTVREGDWASNGNRAEISYDNRDFPGSRGWYGWSFFIPADYPDTEWKPRLWQAIGQWHDQPNREKGETWDTFPGHSPSVALYYVSKNGTPGLELWYGPLKEQAIIARTPVQKGRWNDIIFHIGWSTGADGFIEAWLNGQPLIAPDTDKHTVYGANMWNDYPHFLKIGLYRNKQITTTNSIYFDEVRIGNTHQEVDPACRTQAKPSTPR